MLEYHANFCAHTFNIAQVIVQMNAIYYNPSLLMFFKMIDAAYGGRFSRA